MASLVIIGNGFDLNLGFKTSYADFMASSQFRDIVNENTVASALKRICKPAANWIDIENQLTTLSKGYFPDFKKEVNQLKYALTEYISTVDTSMINTDTYAYRLLASLINDSFIILDFNYTNTVVGILKNLGVSDERVRDSVRKIHGSAEQKNIVFGVEDSADIGRHVFLKKSAQLDAANVSVAQFSKSVSAIHVFGHSLGETDTSYFEDYITEVTDDVRRVDRVKLTFNLYYYGIDSHDKLMEQLDRLTNQQLGRFKQNLNFNAIDCS